MFCLVILISNLLLNCFLPLNRLSDLPLLYIFSTITVSLLAQRQVFHLQSILTRLNFLKYCFHHINFLHTALQWISLLISASANSSYKLLHKLVPVYQFNFISHFSSTPTLQQVTVYYFLHTSASLLLLFSLTEILPQILFIVDGPS